MLRYYDECKEYDNDWLHPAFNRFAYNVTTQQVQYCNMDLRSGSQNRSLTIRTDEEIKAKVTDIVQRGGKACWFYKGTDIQYGGDLSNFCGKLFYIDYLK